MARKKPAPVEPAQLPTLEDLLMGLGAFRLRSASPIQRAMCRAIDGLPLGDLGELPDVIEAFGGREAIAYLQHPERKPLEVYIIGGSRIGKTLLAAAILFNASQTVDLSGLGHGDEPRAPVLSLDKDKANACYLHLSKNIKADGSSLTPFLRHEGRNELDSPALWLRHPSGRDIQVCVTANKAAGNAVVSYFLAAVVFDEACKMSGAGDAVVNFEEARDSALGRLLPGGQLVAIGSPWAPFGPMYEAFQTRHGKPGPDLIVIHARGDLTNPWWWTPERVASLKPKVRRTEVEAKFLTPEESIFGEELLRERTRKGPDRQRLPRQRGLHYAATMDPATRSNSWTLTIGTRVRGRLVVAFAHQWVPESGLRLNPREVLKEAAQLCREYGLDVATTDQWSFDANRVIADEEGLALVEHVWDKFNKNDGYGLLESMVQDNQIELPDNPDLIEDLKLVKRRPTADSTTIVLPERMGPTGVKRHCDYAPALVLLALAAIEETAPLREPTDADQREAERMARWEQKQAQKRAEQDLLFNTMEDMQWTRNR